MLGDEALACLKDLKKWLKLYDEKANRLDVARCLAEANLVKGDLLEILAAWPESANHDRLRSKIALACIELLVPLTWPIEKSDDQMTFNHHRHVPYLQLAQMSYKRAIIEHESLSILRTAVRTGLPSIALPMGERTSRDEGIIKLVLYLFRNVAMISPPANLPHNDKDGEISRSSTIEAFHRQDVLALLLTIGSNIGEDFNTQDVVIMELLFHLLKGVDVDKLFMDKKQLSDKNNDELKSLMSKEANMHRGYLKNAPTRHNRFGTMIWVKRDGEGRHSTVSGQDILKSDQQTLSKMDKTKRFNRPKQRSKDSEPANDRFDIPVPLTEAARVHLRSFVEEFLDSSFNPLFNHVRRAIEREADRVLESHKQQFFYLVSWFLEAERARRRHRKEAEEQRQDHKIAETFEPDSFGLIATVLIQEFFVLLNRFMQKALDDKSWREVQAGMRCFTQILLVVQEMSESPLEEDQEIAENIQNRIFYEETTHDRIIAILRGYKDQGFGYLDACTELAHTFLRVLERYSRENVDMQVRSKRRARKTKRAAARESGEDADDEERDSESEDLREAERVSKERKFDFNRFAAKFMTQACIDTFVSFTKYYSDLNQDQLKRAHRFFHRVAFKQDLSVMVFRIDIIALFNRMIKGPEGLDIKGPMFREWDELVRHIIRRLIKKMSSRPELAVELLFSKIHSTTFYLEYGYEKQTTTSRPRAAAAIEVRGSMSLEEQIGVVVAALHDDHMDYIQWVSKTLSTSADERQSWEAEADARHAAAQLEQNDSDAAKEDTEAAPKAPLITVASPNEETRIALFKNAKLRLLMTLSGFERLGDDEEPNSSWILPSAITSTELRHIRDTIEKHRQDPIFQYGEENPISAEDMLRRKPTPKVKQAEYDDDSEGSGSQGEEEFLFPAGGPTNTITPREALDQLKKNRRKRRPGSDAEIDDETREARRKARAEADLEKRRGIKSAKFVIDSEDDEEADTQFFAREEARRLGQRERVREALNAGRVAASIEGERVKPSVTVGKKRKLDEDDEREGKRFHGSSDSSEADDTDMGDMPSSPASAMAPISSADSGVEDVTPVSSPPPVSLEKSFEDTGASEQPASSPPASGRDVQAKTAEPGMGDSLENDDDDDEKVAGVGRRRVKAAVFDDSDDE